MDITKGIIVYSIFIGISILGGLLFMNATEPPEPLNFFIFGFAAFGILVTIRSIINLISKAIKSKNKVEDNPASETPRGL